MIDFSAYDVKTPEILGYRCSKCGSIYYPAPMICAKCSSRRDPVTGKHWETFPLEGPVKLLSWTRVWNLPEALPNGPKVSHGGSLSPRGDWRAPSDMSARIWLDEIEREVPKD